MSGLYKIYSKVIPRELGDLPGFTIGGDKFNNITYSGGL